MRLANRFRPQKVYNRTTKANCKKNAKRLAANYAVLKALAEADTTKPAAAPKAEKAPAKKAAAPKAEKAPAKKAPAKKAAAKKADAE